MAAAAMSAEVWTLIGLIAGLTVTMCLAVLASLHGHLMKVRKLSEEVRDLREAYNAAFKSVEFVDGPLGAPPADPAKKAA